MGFLGVLIDGNEDGVALGLHCVDGYWSGSGQAQWLARREVEQRAVEPALDLAVLDLALGQRHVCVGAGVVDRVELAVGTGETDGNTVDLDPLGRALGEVVDLADGDEGHSATPDSSPSIALVRRAIR